MKQNLLAVVLLSISIINLTMAQQMYKWKDANGKLHYTDNPAIAAQKNAATLDRPTPQTIPSATAVSSEQIETRRMQDAQQAQQKAQMAIEYERLKTICEEKQAFIKSLKNQGRIIVPDNNQKDGYRYLSDQEIKADIVKAEEDYNSQCRRL